MPHPDNTRHFPALPAAIDLPAMEHEMLGRWQDGKVFERSLEQTAAGPLWTFYEGPPPANGTPGVHHIEARVFKDVFPRFKTMQGFHVPRQAGWDCHGLPVEVAVEKELGLSGKKDIEAYGVAAFNERCRESVLRYVDAFEELTDRLGYWVDLDRAYRTMDPSYIESVWWSLKVIYDKGLLVRDYRISPYCPRCETPLSDHEMGQPDVYETVTDPSVTVRFPLTDLPAGANPLLAGADLLVWTTTPWTLVSNTAVAVHPDETYALARKAGDSETVVGSSRPGAGRGLAHRRPGTRSGAGGIDLPPSVQPDRDPGCAPGRDRRLRHHRRRHRARAPRACLRRGRHGDRQGARPAGGEPDPARRPVRRAGAARRRDVLQGRRRATGQRPGRPRPAVPVPAA
jgi:isoleucyl-tRNA synthetase